MYKLFLFLPFFFTSCTYSINQIHSQGTATDLIDETANQNPNISIPIIKPIPKAR